MEKWKRRLSLVLALVMVIGLLPLSALAIDGEDDEVLDAAIFFSDVHDEGTGMTSSGGSAMMAVLQALNGTADYSSMTFVGDTYTNTAGTTASATAQAQSAVGSTVDCNYVWGDHDYKSNIDTGSGLLYENDNYYVYGISMEDMYSKTSNYVSSLPLSESQVQAHIDAFTAWAETADRTKPLFICSHVPLHARRNDNTYAALWYTAITAVANTMDVVFFWGHNHTNETSADTAAYYVEKNGDETMTIAGGATVTPNFTYMNAGYIYAAGQSPARKGVATTVRIYADKLVFQDYNSSGTYSGTYAHNVTVERSNKAETATKTLTDITLTGVEQVYTLGDTLCDFTVNAVYADGTTKALTDGYQVSGADMAKTGKQTVTVTYTENDVSCAATFDIYVISGKKLVSVALAESVSVVSGGALNLGTMEFALVYYGYYNDAASTTAVGDVEYEDTSDHVVITEYVSGTDSRISVTYPANSDEISKDTQIVVYAKDGNDTVSAAYTVTAELDEGQTGIVIVSCPETWTSATEETAEVSATVTEGTTTYTEKTVYVLTGTLTAGKEYLIVNKNTAGTGYALINNSGTKGSSSVTINAIGNTDYYTADGSVYTATNPYIVSDVSAWTVGGSSSSGYTFKNGDYYLYASSSRGNASLSLNKSSKSSWTYSNNRLSTSISSNNWGGTTTYYLHYNSGWTITSQSNNAGSVYFYEKTTVYEKTDTSASVTYTVKADDMVWWTDSADTTKTIVPTFYKDGTEISGATYRYGLVNDPNGILDADKTENATIAFSGNTGTAQVRVYADFTDGNGDTQTVYTTISVTAKEPTYQATVNKVNFTAENITEFADGITYYTYNAKTGWYTRVDASASFDATETYYTYHAESLGDEISGKTVVLKGVTQGRTYALLSSLQKIDSGHPDGEKTTTYDAVTWTVDDESIATIQNNNGVGLLTFTGNEGLVKVTVSYTIGSKTYTTWAELSVTRALYTVPEDGTNDFPEYPAEGSVKFDKTADAVGNFSQTGLAKVELSMTGVPYSTGTAIDVLLMIDMSTSMDTVVGTDSDGEELDRVDVTIAATKAFAKQIVKNADDTYNSNQIAIKYFNGDTVYTTTDYVSVSSDAELEALYTKIATLNTPNSTGTNYTVAMQTAYETILANDAKSDHTQTLVFMSDGGPTEYTYLNDNNTSTDIEDSKAETYVAWFTVDNTADTATVNSNFKTEYYSYKLKEAGYPIYTVGLGLSTVNSSSGPQAYRSLSSAQQEAICGYILTQMATNANYFYSIADSDAVNNMGNIFAAIAKSITEAATDVTVEDKIGEEFDVQFKLPQGVEKTDTNDFDEFYIQVVEYILDENNERTGDYKVLENFTFNEDGTLKSHTINGETTTVEGDTCDHVTLTNGTVTEINGTYFKYYIGADGGEYLEWKADKLTANELALQYFVYLEDSGGRDEAEEQIAAGTYQTNEYAYLYYTNYQGNQTKQEFPIPQMTWKGAHVTYLFYLVNENGEPVNRAGQVVPFANAVYVTDPVSFAVTWNNIEGAESLLAENLMAEANVPSVYRLYDENAEYEIRVYQTEGVDGNNGKDYNFFKIRGSNSGLQSYTTTKVYNTKAGTRYEEYGVYSSQPVGTYLTSLDDDVIVTDQLTGFDYANTTVAFGVVWTLALKEDTVVVDFGLDTVIDVITNDVVNATVTGVMQDAPGGITENTGTYSNSRGTTAITGDAWKVTAESANNNAVRFVQTNMQFHEPAKFYYEANVTYQGQDALVSTYMYSSVTVIPATSVYYEDSFVTYASYTKGDDGKYTEDETAQWTKVGTTVSAKQDVDRPGVDNVIDSAYDANNPYGYDSAYTAMSQYSLGSAMKANVYAGHYAKADFEFYGTGFDIISLTSNTTGTILVDIYTLDSDGNWVLSNDYYAMVDTYFGYAYQDGQWVTVSDSDPNALYQVPVIKLLNMPYGHYKAEITVSYISAMDHTEPAGYDFYLDAIRIYDPCGTNQQAQDVYGKDGEAQPEYIELRNQIISASEFAQNPDTTFTGAIFIDGIGNTTKVSDYVSYGPNNELYLAKGQAVAFSVNGSNVQDIQIALKLASGSAATCKINGKEITVSTATDLYYSILDLVDDAGVWTIQNTGDGILSVTNIKITQKVTADDEVAETTALYMNAELVNGVLLSLRGLTTDAVVEPTEPTATEPAVTEPTATEPATTEPASGTPAAPNTDTDADHSDNNGISDKAEPEVTEPNIDNSNDESNGESGNGEHSEAEDETDSANGSIDFSGILRAIGNAIMRAFGRLINSLF